MNAAIYVRVSTEEQAENGTSLDTQREQSRAYVKARKWKFMGKFADEGVSGTKGESGRDGLRALMQGARDGTIDVVVVTKVDRFSRSIDHFSTMVKELDRLGVGFVSVTEGFDSTNLTGQLLRNILASFAEFEHGRITERMKEGKRKIAAQGYWTGGPLPFGFRAIEDGAHKRLVVDESKAETIRLAASLLVDKGCSTWEIAERLNALGCKPARAAKWDNILLRYMLQREMLVPAILDKQTFARVQKALASTSFKKRSRDHVYPLSLRIVGKCGERYHGVFRRDMNVRFYSCNSKKWENRHERCEDPSIRADDIEYVVWEQVCDLLSKPERLVALADEYLGLRGQQIEFERDEYKETQKKTEALDKAIQSTLVTSAKAGLGPRDIEAAVAELTGERDALQRHLGMIEAWRADSAHTRPSG